MSLSNIAFLRRSYRVQPPCDRLARSHKSYHAGRVLREVRYEENQAPRPLDRRAYPQEFQITMTSASNTSIVSLDLQTIKTTCCKCQHDHTLTGTADLKCSGCGHIPDAMCKYQSSVQNVPQIGDLDNQLEIIICDSCGLGQLFEHPWPMHSEKGKPVCEGCKKLFGTLCARFVRAPLFGSTARASGTAVTDKGKHITDIPKSRSWNSATCPFCWLDFDRPCAGNKRAVGEQKKADNPEKTDEQKKAEIAVLRLII